MTPAGSPGPDLPGGIAPVCGNQPRVLVLGSFPSIISLEHRQYYGNPQNRFWRIMEDLFAVDRTLPYGERIRQIEHHGIALWDVIGSCSREGSADSRIRNPVYNDIMGFLAVHPSVVLVVLNGSAAAAHLHKAPWTIGINTIVLPSTSPANARTGYAELLEKWSVLKKAAR